MKSWGYRHGLLAFYFVLLAAIGGISHATAGEVDPYVGTHVAYDNNLFRLSDAVDPMRVLGKEERSDVMYTNTAGIDVQGDQDRQKYALALRIDENRFRRFTLLNNQSRVARANWDWQTRATLNGRVGYEYTRALSSFSDIQSVIRNIRSQRYWYVDGGIDILPHWRAHAGVDRAIIDYSAEQWRASSYATDGVDAGIGYRSGAGNTVDFYTRRSRINFVQAVDVSGAAIDNDYRGVDSGVRLVWNATAASQFDAQLAYARRTHAQYSQRDFNGPTGRLTYNWSISAKTHLQTTLWRDTEAAEDAVSSYIVTQGVSLAPTWAATERVNVKPLWSYSRVDYRGDAATLLGAERREDRIERRRLAVDYSWIPQLYIGLSFEQGRRRSNALLVDYRYRMIAADLRLTF